ncbi:MAG: Fic family protein [Bacteroidaceae bacterium]|nr:Fic family protein [Bacteroidaceae bacterium]
MTISELLREYKALGIGEQIDYSKFYLYSIITHSTAIEGSTVTELENQLLFDEGITAKGKPLTEQMMNLDLKNAYEWGMETFSQHPAITIDLLKTLSAKVMARTGSEYKALGGTFSSARGDLRLLNVTAGFGGRSYLNYTKVPQHLSDFCDEINKRRAQLDANAPETVYELSFWAHYHLVTIHPWADGNGRTSRLLMNLLQMEYGVLPMKIYKEEKAEYIQALIDTREQEDESIFIKAMMQLHTQHLQDEITAFRTSMEREMSEKNVRKELSERQRHILSLIAADSRITTEQMSEKTGVNEKTIRRDLAILQQQGIIERVGGRKLGQWMIKEGKV